MSTQKTPILNMNKWVETDELNSGEFNENFTKLDTEVGKHGADVANLKTDTQNLTQQMADTVTLVKTTGGDDSSIIQTAIDNVASVGGGTVRLPDGLYYANISLKDNVRLEGSGTTEIKASGGSTVVDVIGNNATLADLRLSGINDVGAVRAGHVLKVGGEGVRILNVTAKEGRFDSLYVHSATDLRVVDSHFMQTTRNTVSIVNGSDMSFDKCVFYQDKTHGSLYLVDIEPDFPNFVRDVYFSNCVFDMEVTASSSVILKDSRDTEEYINIFFDSCEFRRHAHLRINSNNLKGLHVSNCNFEMYPINSPIPITWAQGTFKSSKGTDSTRFAYNITFGEVMIESNNFPSWAGLNLDRINSFNNFGLQDIANNAKSIVRISPLIRDYGAYSIVGEGGVAQTLHIKSFDISNTVAFTDVLSLNKRATYKITIGGIDATSGRASAGYVEIFAVLSDGFIDKVITERINNATHGVDVQFKDMGGSFFSANPDAKTLQIRPRNATSNQWAIKVEVLSHEAHSGITWL